MSTHGGDFPLPLLNDNRPGHPEATVQKMRALEFVSPGSGGDEVDLAKLASGDFNTAFLDEGSISICNRCPGEE